MANEYNARRTWDYLKSLGLDDLRAAAIMGNLSQESGFDTGAISYDGEGSLGIAQWTYDRRTALEALGGDPTNLDTQLQHFGNEIAEGGARHYAWANLMNNGGDLYDLVSGWCDDFETPDPAYANKTHRFDEAQRYLKMFGEGRGETFTGSLMGDVLAPLHAKESNYVMYGDLSPAVSAYDDDEPVRDISTPEAIVSNFLDSMTTSGVANALQFVWGGIAHSGKWRYEQKDPVTQEDVAFVQQTLPGDKDAQQFILLNGRDSQEIRWLVNQKLVDKNRQAQIARWKEQNDSILKKSAVAIAGGAGYLIDPLNLVPMGSAIKGAQMIGRLGSALHNVGKAREIAQIAAKTGYELAKMNAPMGGAALTNSYLKDTFSGEEVNYAYDIGAAMLASTVLSFAGVGAGKAISAWRGRGRTLTEEAAAIAERAESRVYQHAAGLTDEQIRTETIGRMRALHNADFGKKLGSKIYERIEEKGRVIAAPYEKVSALVSRISGRDLPRDAKAFYVPNEDYTVLITDNIKDAAHAERVLAHEIGIHAGLEKTIGTDNYNALMRDVQKHMNKRTHVFHQIRRKYDTQDPEEVFAHAIEDDILPAAYRNRIQGVLNKLLGERDYHITLGKEDIMKILKGETTENARVFHGFHYNEDGTTALAGVLFSRDNQLNPQLWADLYALEPEITARTQADIGTHLPKGAQQLLQKVTKRAENGIFGLMLNSPSNTARGLANQLFTDPRGRGLGNITTLCAEEMKDYIVRRLAIPLLDMARERTAWMQRHKKIQLRKAQLAFDDMVFAHYNAKYAGNKASILGNVPKEVDRAADALHRYRQEQIEIGKHSATYFGARAENLIESDWEAIDHELWRMTDNDLRQRFFDHFNTFEEAEEQLGAYIRAFAKRDIIRQKIARGLTKENKRIAERNVSLEERGLAPLPLKDTTVTDKMVEEWLEARIPAALEQHLQMNLDPINGQNIGELGHLNFLRERIPMDTSGVMVMNQRTKNAFEFSFDNNLRLKDLDIIMQKNMNRFAGEIAARNIFGTEQNLQKILGKIEKELHASASTGRSNQSIKREYEDIVSAIRELRGGRPREDALTRMDALARIGIGLSYVKNGANMGFSQLGEIGGAIAYGGAQRIFGAIPALRDLAADIRCGRVTREAYQDAEQYMFGKSIEAAVWDVNYAEVVVRDALTEKDSIANRLLIKAGDITNLLSKVTSTLNMLPKMTDSMYRDMRTGYLMDAFKWAEGHTFDKSRNPFSPAKLRASHVTEEMAERIKTQLRQVSTKDKNGNVTHLDMQTWLKSDPESFFKFRGMGQAQAERAIVSGTKQGNKNLWRNRSPFFRVITQFKDYNLRAINGQTLRAMTAGELDDAIALGMSIATNTAAYMMRVGAKGAALYALGDAAGANDYLKRMFDEGQLLRVAALRSAFSSPLSFGNDVYEALAGGDTIRTTVDRQGRRQAQRDESDIIGDFVSQLPAVQTTVGSVYKALRSGMHLVEGEGTKRDLRELFHALPIPNFIPFMTYIDHVIGGSSLPDKPPKK